MSQARRRPKRSRQPRHLPGVDHRRPDEFERVGQAGERQQADGAEVDAAVGHPHAQRLARQRQRQTGGEAEQHDDEHAGAQVDRQGGEVGRLLRIACRRGAHAWIGSDGNGGQGLLLRRGASVDGRSDRSAALTDRGGRHGALRAGDRPGNDVVARASVRRRLSALPAVAQQEFTQHFPRSGWVEHDAEEIWSSVLATAREAVAKAAARQDVVGIGISNQRETSIVWERATGRPIHNAIVWQDRRTAEACEALRAAGHERVVDREDRAAARSVFFGDQDRLDPRSRPRRARTRRARRARLRHHRLLSAVAPDGRARARNRRDQRRAHLPARHSHRRAGTTSCSTFSACRARCCRRCATTRPSSAPPSRSCSARAIPIRGMAGDQQAATIGQACFTPGMLKSTYGTGCFAVLNTGSEAIASKHRLLTTIAYQLGGKRTYALEGSIFVAGAAVQWLRDGLKVIARASEAGGMAARRRCRAGCGAGAGVRRSRRAVLGSRLPRRAVRPNAQHRPQRAGARGAAVGVLPDLSTCCRRCAPIARRRRRPCCAPTAAWRRAIGRCSGWPTSSMRLSTGRRWWRRRRWARPISPACKPASIPSRPAIRRTLGARQALHARHGGCRALAPPRLLARRRLADAD